MCAAISCMAGTETTIRAKAQGGITSTVMLGSSAAAAKCLAFAIPVRLCAAGNHDGMHGCNNPLKAPMPRRASDPILCDRDAADRCCLRDPVACIAQER